MNKLSWQTKLMGLIALVLGALLLFQVFYAIPYVRNQEVENAEIRQEEVARNIARELDLDLKRSEGNLTKMAQLAAFRNMDLVTQNQIMITIIETSGRFSSLFVFDTEGWIVSGSVEDLSRYQAKSYADQPFFSVPFEQGEVHFALPQFLSKLGVITSVSVPIESETGKRIGVLRGGMILNDLIESVANYPLQAGTVAYLVDTEGTVVARSGMDLFALEEGPLSLDYSGRPLVQAIMAGEMSGSLKHDHDGTPYFGSYVTLESNGWGVVVEAPMSSILAASEALAGRLLAVNIALFAMALAVSLVFARQITVEQRRAEEALRKSEQWFSTTLKSIGDAVIATDARGLVTLMNPVVEDLTGWEEAEAVGQPLEVVFNIINEQTGERAENPVARVLREGVVVGLANHTVLIAKDGTKRPIADSGAPMRDEEGNIIGTVMVFRDITERKQAEEELASSGEFLNSVIEQSPVSLWISDSEGTLIKLNQSCRELFGLKDEEVVGKYNLFKDNLIEEQGFMPLVENVFEKGEIARFTIDYDLPRVEHLKIDRATYRILDVTISPIKDMHGKVTNAIVQHKDITERRRAEDALAQRVEELERFHRLAVGRELRMIELKRQVNELAEQLGKEAPYDLSLLE